MSVRSRAGLIRDADEGIGPRLLRTAKLYFALPAQADGVRSQNGFDLAGYPLGRALLGEDHRKLPLQQVVKLCVDRHAVIEKRRVDPKNSHVLFVPFFVIAILSGKGLRLRLLRQVRALGRDCDRGAQIYIARAAESAFLPASARGCRS